MTNPSATPQILRYLEASGGGKLIRAWPLDGGVSTSMTAFEVELPNGKRRKLIARRPSPRRFQQNPEVAAQEFRVLRTLREAGLPVPRAVALVPGSDTTPEPCMILEYIEGRPELAPPDEERYLRKYAEQLARIHRLDPSKLDLGFLSTHADRRRKRREGTDDSMRDSMREGEILKALESFEGKTPPRPNPLPSSLFRLPTCLCHGDFWPGNVLWRDGEIAAVIDWEECLIGDPLSDLAICRLDLWWILGETTAERFTAIYQSLTSLDLTHLPYWDLRAALRPIPNIGAWSASYPPLGRPDVTEATMRRDHLAFVARALSNFS